MRLRAFTRGSMRFGAKLFYIAQRYQKGTLDAVAYRARRKQLAEEYLPDFPLTYIFLK